MVVYRNSAGRFVSHSDAFKEDGITVGVVSYQWEKSTDESEEDEYSLDDEDDGEYTDDDDDGSYYDSDDDYFGELESESE